MQNGLMAKSGDCREWSTQFATAVDVDPEPHSTPSTSGRPMILLADPSWLEFAVSTSNLTEVEAVPPHEDTGLFCLLGAAMPSAALFCTGASRSKQHK